MAIILIITFIIALAVYLKYDFKKLPSDLVKKFSFEKKLLPTTKTIWDIPGPYRVPFLGTKWTFLFGKYKMSKLHEALSDMNEEYGPVALEVTPGGIPIVHLFDKNDIERVLKYPSKYPFRPPTEIVVQYRRSKPERYSSVGITNEQGVTWQHLRNSLTSEITSPKILQGFIPALNYICDDFIELLRHRRDPLTFEVEHFEDIANLMGLEAVCLLMLGRRMGFLSRDPQQSDKIKSLAAAVKQLFVSQRDSYYGLGLWKYFPTKTYRQFAQSEELIYNVITEIVDEGIKEKTNGNDNGLKCIFMDIFKRDNLDERDKKSAIIDFVAAGIETLANTLIFVLNHVTHHRDATERIFAEFERCKNSEILQDAITNAILTKACLQETYRLQPTAFCLARVLEEDTKLSDYEVKAGNVVLCQTMIACNKDSNFTHAKSFEPDRWIQNESLNVNAESSSIVVPFGFGKRTCPGKRFVEMELVLLLAKLVSAFNISFPKPLETEFEFLLVPKTPLSLKLEDRCV